MLQTVPMWHRDKDDNFPLPRMTGIGNGDSILVSQKIDTAIFMVAHELMSADQSLSRKVTRAEWRALVRHSFGPALAMIDLEVDPAENADAVLTQIKSFLSKHINGYGVREFAFGCTLFGNSGIMPFSIGPVCFEPRTDWLNRKSSDGALSATTRRRVEQAWSGKRLRMRRLSADSMCEPDLLDAIGSCPFVCSVTTNGLAAGAGRDKALTAARLAIAAIALLWVTPSRTLEGMNLWYDRRIHRQEALSFIRGKIVLTGSRQSHAPHGPSLKGGEWETDLVEYRDHFRIVEEILDYVIDPIGNVARPKLINALAQALLWFHEGCREIVTLMAIVKFWAALDALACAGNDNGVIKLIEVRLGIKKVTRFGRMGRR